MDNTLCPNVQKMLDKLTDELTPGQLVAAEERHKELVRGFVDDWQSFYSQKVEVIGDGKCRTVLITLPDRHG